MHKARRQVILYKSIVVGPGFGTKRDRDGHFKGGAASLREGG